MLPFSLAQGHSAMCVPWRALTFPWLLTLRYEAIQTRVSCGCFITAESIRAVEARRSLNFSIQFVTLGTQYQSAFSEFHSCSCQ